MSPRALAVVIICLAVISLSIALGFFSLGMWLVLPFAGLELLVVGIAIGLSVRSGEEYELVVVDEQTVKISRHLRRRNIEYVFDRYWTQVRLNPGPVRLHASRLWIGSHGRFVELGRGLTEFAREELAARLKKAVRAGR